MCYLEKSQDEAKTIPIYIFIYENFQIHEKAQPEQY